MYCIKTQQQFDAAHFLKGYDGKCRNIHGHTWRVVAHISGSVLAKEGPGRGMLADFACLKKALEKVCARFDHCLIYEKGSLKESTLDALLDEGFAMTEVSFRPTAENFASYFYGQLKAMGFNMHLVEVYETEKNCASYSEEA